MQQKPFYPDLKEANLMPLKAILAQIERFPDLLDQPECPWSEEVKALIRPILKPVSGLPNIEIDLNEGRPEAIEAQILGLMADLRTMKQGMGAKDHAEKIQFYKLMTTLVEKLIALRERTMNLREMSEFQTLILQFLDEVCSKDQISELMARLKNLSSIGEINDLRD